MGRAVELLLKPTVSGSNLVDTVRGASAALATNMTTAADSPFGAGESSVTFSGICTGITTASYLSEKQIATKSEPLTIEGWIKHTASGAGTIFELTDSNNAQVKIAYTATPTITCTCQVHYNTTQTVSVCSISSNLYTHGVSSGWVHYAFVIDTTDLANVTAILYINGNVAASTRMTNYINSSYTSGPTSGFYLETNNTGAMWSASAVGASFYGLQFTRGALIYTGSFTPPVSGNPLNVSAYGKIYGTIYQGTTPVSTLLRCYKVSDGSLIATTTSASDGTYSFNNLVVGTQYFVVSANNVYQDVSSKIATAVTM